MFYKFLEFSFFENLLNILIYVYFYEMILNWCDKES